MSNNTANNQKFIGTFSLAMINTAVIVNLNNLPSMVVVGYALISYLLLAAVFFFLPTAFISAELATGWPVKGGFYTWARTAFGPVFGFQAVWLQWIANVIWYPTLLAPAVVSSLDVFAPHLASDKWSLFIIMVGMFWFLTWLNLRGMRESSLISSVGIILGSLLPAGLLLIFAAIWISKGFPIALHYHANELIPPLNNFGNMSILISILVTLAGMEMSAVHVNNVVNPRKTYPRAILIAVLIIMGVFIFVSLALAVIVPGDKIDLVTGVVQGINSFGNAVHIPQLTSIFTALIAIGIFTIASTWISGPSKGLQISAIDSNLPAFFQKINRHEMPHWLLILQAVLFTLLTSLFIFMPSINGYYWILIALTGQLYMLMYFMLFITGIRLRYKYPNVVREYRIPGKRNLGMWIVGGCGILGSSTAFIMTYFPPDQVSNIQFTHYISFLLISFAGFYILPVAIYALYYYFYHKKHRYVKEPVDERLSLAEEARLPVKLDEINPKA